MLRIDMVDESRIPAYGEIRNAWNQVLAAREKSEEQEAVFAEAMNGEDWDAELERLQAMRMKQRIREEEFVELSLKRKACIIPRYDKRHEDD